MKSYLKNAYNYYKIILVKLLIDNIFYLKFENLVIKKNGYNEGHIRKGEGNTDRCDQVVIERGRERERESEREWERVREEEREREEERGREREREIERDR